jgi:ribonuclease BN (tRNA processing enzyme)
MAHDGEREWKIVMDLGSGALGAIQRYTDLEDIDAIFLTHLHPDHCMDLCGLHVAVRWKPGGWGRDRLPVWGPAATADRMATAYGLDLDPGMHEEFDVLLPRNRTRTVSPSLKSSPTREIRIPAKGWKTRPRTPICSCVRQRSRKAGTTTSKMFI